MSNLNTCKIVATCFPSHARVKLRIYVKCNHLATQYCYTVYKFIRIPSSWDMTTTKIFDISVEITSAIVIGYYLEMFSGYIRICYLSVPVKCMASHANMWGTQILMIWFNHDVHIGSIQLQK